jgi:hypothetical protein
MSEPIATTTIQLPLRLAKEAEIYIQSGWSPDLNTLVVEALRRYLESPRMELQERFLLQDVEWALKGND